MKKKDVFLYVMYMATAGLFGILWFADGTKNQALIMCAGILAFYVWMFRGDIEDRDLLIQHLGGGEAIERTLHERAHKVEEATNQRSFKEATAASRAFLVLQHLARKVGYTPRYRTHKSYLGSENDAEVAELEGEV